MLLTRSLLPVLLAAAATACAQQGARRAREDNASCELPVIVAFASPPTDTVLADLGRAAGARLEEPASLTTNIYSLTLRANGGDAVCRDAADRLRGDPRVRSVDLDERRQIQAR